MAQGGAVKKEGHRDHQHNGDVRAHVGGGGLKGLQMRQPGFLCKLGGGTEIGGGGGVLHGAVDQVVDKILADKVQQQGGDHLIDIKVNLQQRRDQGKEHPCQRSGQEDF